MKVNQWRRFVPLGGCLALLALWQFVWWPAQARLQQAERSLAHVRDLSARLQAASINLDPPAVVRQPITPAGLNERAQAAGLRVIGLEVSGTQGDVSLDGPPAEVVQWLHDLEREGVRLISLQLQVQGDSVQVQASLGLGSVGG